jgi:hypothetical protein
VSSRNSTFILQRDTPVNSTDLSLTTPSISELSTSPSTSLNPLQSPKQVLPNQTQDNSTQNPMIPTTLPTKRPLRDPTVLATSAATPSPTKRPSPKLTRKPSLRPTRKPTLAPTSNKLPIKEFKSLEELVEMAKLSIEGIILDNLSLGPTIIRLGFHDCVPNGDAGGCDGCLNLSSNPANQGLLPAVLALDPLVASFESDEFGVSRADLWALAVLVAADLLQNEIMFSDGFQIGRINCENVGTCSRNDDPIFCSRNGPDREDDYPSALFVTHELLDFFDEHFGFNADQTVAIMGAHTLGVARPDDSGYEGLGGWVPDIFLLGEFPSLSNYFMSLSMILDYSFRFSYILHKIDNDYYKQIVGPSNGRMNNAPDWTQVVVPSGKVQWIRDAGGDIPIMMLNVDIALVRDLNEEDIIAECEFKAPSKSRCPAAMTLTKAGVYRDNNQLWLEDFREVLLMMLEKGLQ